jgi:hypothetical protein
VGVKKGNEEVGKDRKKRGKYEKMGGWTHTHTHTHKQTKKHKENFCYLTYVLVKFAMPKTLHKLTNSDILEKRKVIQAVREFVAFYVTLNFITMFTTATFPFPEPE